MAPQAAQTSPGPTTLATPNRQHKRRREGTPDSLAVAVRGHPQPARASAGLRPPPPLQSPCSPAATARLQPVAINANPRDRARRSAPAATPAEDAAGREPRQHHATKEPFGRALQRAPDSRRRARHQRPRRPQSMPPQAPGRHSRNPRPQSPPETAARCRCRRPPSSLRTTHRRRASMSRWPPDPGEGGPDPWPPAATATGGPPPAARSTGTRAAAPTAETPWRRKEAMPPPSLEPHVRPEASSGGGTTGSGTGGGSAAARSWPPGAARARATRGRVGCFLCCSH
jgi:hypothetical protein